LLKNEAACDVVQLDGSSGTIVNGDGGVEWIGINLAVAPLHFVNVNGIVAFIAAKVYIALTASNRVVEVSVQYAFR
jgi:hypothetical protein